MHCEKWEKQTKQMKKVAYFSQKKTSKQINEKKKQKRKTQKFAVPSTICFELECTEATTVSFFPFFFSLLFIFICWYIFSTVLFSTRAFLCSANFLSLILFLYSSYTTHINKVTKTLWSTVKAALKVFIFLLSACLFLWALLFTMITFC